MLNFLKKTETTENTNGTFFESKEHYLNFRKAWSESVNSPEGKESITAAHHLLYAALRKVDWSRGFTPITNANKLANGMYPNHGFDMAIYTLKSYATGYQSKYPERIEAFLAPFKGTVTHEMLKEAYKFIEETQSTYMK